MAKQNCRTFFQYSLEDFNLLVVICGERNIRSAVEKTHGKRASEASPPKGPRPYTSLTRLSSRTSKLHASCVCLHALFSQMYQLFGRSVRLKYALFVRSPLLKRTFACSCADSSMEDGSSNVYEYTSGRWLCVLQFRY